MSNGNPSYDVVAKKFNRSRSTIQKLSTFFKWAEKRDELKKEDDKQFVGDLTLTIGEIRREAIRTNRIIRQWVNDLARMHQTLVEGKRDPTPEEEMYMKRLRKAIDDFNPKDLREMTADLQQNVSFYPEKKTGHVLNLPPGESQKGGQPIEITGPCLIIMEPGDKNAKQKTISALQKAELTSSSAQAPGE
jgi:hypothetical protein